MQKIMRYTRAAVDKYGMIENGDKIAVGVSGGKDSLMLLWALAQLKRFYPHGFELTAVTADPCFGGKETDFSGVEALCKGLGVQYVLRRTHLGEIIFEERKEKNPCSLCARMRRGILHNMAKEAGCNKIALGHHYDDAVQTFVMNLIYGGRIGCFSPKTYLSRKDITLIRPLIFCMEKELAAGARRLSLPVVKSLCPADGSTSRKKAADMISSLQKTEPDIKAKIMGAMQRAGLDGW
jgi:tRNA(Ile)-lysidine synthase TilS/MesJ